MGLLESASGFLGNFVNWAATAQQNKKQRQWSEDQAEWTYAKDLEQWNRQNDYNSPAAQMGRLKEAGLNPALMYSQGDTGNAGTFSAPNISGQDVYGLPPQDWKLDDLNNLERDRMYRINNLLGYQEDIAFWEAMEKGFNMGMDWGEPGKPEIIINKTSRKRGNREKTYELQHPTWKSTEGDWNLGPLKFYDLQSAEFDTAKKMAERDEKQVSARREQIQERMDKILEKMLKKKESDIEDLGVHPDLVNKLDYLDAYLLKQTKAGYITKATADQILKALGGIKNIVK